jgi:hypothetical protein
MIYTFMGCEYTVGKNGAYLHSQDRTIGPIYTLSELTRAYDELAYRENDIDYTRREFPRSYPAAPVRCRCVPVPHTSHAGDAPPCPVERYFLGARRVTKAEYDAAGGAANPASTAVRGGCEKLTPEKPTGAPRPNREKTCCGQQLVFHDCKGGSDVWFCRVCGTGYAEPHGRKLTPTEAEEYAEAHDRG